MDRLLSFCVKRHKVVVLATLFLFLAGVYSYLTLPRQENPDISTPIALVSVIFPGASAEEVEQLVTIPVEDEAAKLSGIEYIASTAGENISVTQVVVDYSVDKEAQWDALRQNIDELAKNLPDGCQTPTIDTTLFVEPAGMILAITGPGYTIEQLNGFAEEVKAQLVTVDGLKKTTINGVPNQQVMVKLSAEQLNQYAISVNDIYDVFQAQNVQIPAGSLKTPSGNIKVTVPGSFQDFHDIEQMIIAASPNGAVIRLKDVAEVYLAPEENTARVYGGNQPAVIVASYFESGQNTDLLAPKIDAALTQAGLALPTDVTLSKALYQPDEVNTAVASFVQSLILGILLVLLVILVGMGHRSAFLVSLSLPISIFATLVAMALIKMPLHQVSLAGLIIALGMLVDNAIVVVDAISVRINQGEPRDQAAINGAKESAAPVFSSTLTTIAAFTMLFSLPGEAKEFVQSLPIVVIIALLASYLAAMLIVPTIAARVLVPINTAFKLEKLQKRFTQALAWGMKKPKALIALVGTTFLISLFVALAVLPLRIFPNVDKDYLYIHITNQEKDDLSSTAAIAEQANDILRSFPQVSEVTYTVGGYLPKMYLTSPMGFDTPDFAQMLVKIDLKANKTYPTREKLRMALQDGLNGKIPSADISVNLFTITMPGPGIDVRLTGRDRQALNQAALALEEKLMVVDHVYNVFDDQALAKYEYYIDVNDDQATLYGLTRYDIQRQINIAINGTTAGTWRNGTQEHTIYLQSDIADIESLKNFKIKSSVLENTQVMLRQVAEVTLKTAEPKLPRYDRVPSIQVTAEVRDEGSIQSVQKIIEQEILPTIDTSNMNVVFGGEKTTISKYLNGLGVAGVLAVVLIYLILMLQFDSLRKPLIIMATVPLSVIGAIFGLWVCRQPFSFMAGLGIVSLIGIVVNNAILLVEYISRAHANGEPIDEACHWAVARRFRPIMLSSVTTIIGLIPLALSGSSLFVPLAITLIFGLMVSTGLTLVIIPSIYFLVEK